MNLTELRAEIAFQRELHQEHIRRVRLLKIQQARKGHDCPPGVIIEIEDTETHIAKIEYHIGELETLLAKEEDFRDSFTKYKDLLIQVTEQPVGDIGEIFTDLRDTLNTILAKLDKPTTEEEHD